MPSGSVHSSYWKRFLWLAGVVGLLTLPLSWEFSVFFFTGYLLGYYVDPDLDQIGITSAEGRMLKIPLGFLWVAYWIPYGALIPHRHFLSHSVIISTFVRYMYGFWWLAYLTLIYLPDYVIVHLFVFAGLAASDAVHILLDRGHKKHGRTKRSK